MKADETLLQALKKAFSIGKIYGQVFEGIDSTDQTAAESKKLEFERLCEATIKNLSSCDLQHSDDEAVDKFAQAMKQKLAQAREKGRSGWEQMNPADISAMLREHVEKGDPRDVANFCMFLWNLGQPITPCKPIQTEPVAQPYAYVYEFDSGMFGIHRSFSSNERNGSKPSRVVPVYTHPAPVVDLTHMVNRFLGWKLPMDFAPDCGISIDTEIAGRNGWPSGTNLLNAEQAKQMFEYVTQVTPAVADFSDAYHGAREDLAIWKKRALEAEELNRKFIGEINGQTFMGEPAPAVAQEPVVCGYIFNVEVEGKASAVFDTADEALRFSMHHVYLSSGRFQEAVDTLNQGQCFMYSYGFGGVNIVPVAKRKLPSKNHPPADVVRELVEALNDFSNYVRTEQSSTDGQVQYSNTQINRLAFKARAAIAAAEAEKAKGGAA